MSFNPHQWYLMGLAQSIAHLTLSTTSTSAAWSPQTVTNSGSTLTWDVTGDIAPTSQTINDPTFNLSANTGTVNMDVYDVSSLSKINLDSSELTTLDLSQATSLTEVSCNFNSGISILNVSNNLLLTKLGIQFTSISNIDVSENILLTNLILDYTPLSIQLNVSENTSLTELSFANSNQTSIDVSTNVNLLQLRFSVNAISTLDISLNTLLTSLLCNTNNFTALNLSNNTNLLELDCASNTISSLDLSNNTNLTQLYCQGNNMASSATDQIYIDLANGTGINGNLQIRNNRTSSSDSARATLVSRGWTFDESYTT